MEINMKSIRAHLIPLLILVLLAILPLLIKVPYFLHVLIQFFFFITLAQSWNLIAGYTGQFCFGQQTFLALGAYTTALVWLGTGMPFLGIALGGLVAALSSCGIGLVTFRLRGHYFAIATLVMAEMLRIVFINWNFVGAVYGLTLPVIPVLSGKLVPYYLFLSLCAFTLFLMDKIKKTWFGLAIMAIREDEDVAKTTGINTTKYKLLSFAVSTALAGLAGGLFAFYNLYVEATTVFNILFMFDMIIIVAIGGIGTVFGPVLGAVILTVMYEYILFEFPLYWYFIGGGLLIVTIVFIPGGIISLTKKFGLSLP